MTDPDDRPSPSELIETPPDRVTLGWCGYCAVLASWSPRPCASCGRDRAAITYVWADELADQ